MMRTLGLGDNVCDKYMHISTIYPGGNALNVAVFSGMLGAESAYLGTFGDDEVGRHVYHVASEIGLDLSHCRLEHGANGCARVQLVNGDRVFLTGNRGGISWEKPPLLTAIDEEYIGGFDLVHTSVYSFLEPQFPVIRRAAKFVSMDFSNQMDDAYFMESCPYIDCAEISCGDREESEIRDIMRKIFTYGCKQIVIATRGAKGAFVQVGEKFYEQSPHLVKARDTMGAGDAFIACFLTNYLNGIGQATDFSNGAERGMTSAAEYKDCLVRLSLYRASLFSSAQCERDGSFGYGKHVTLTDEDQMVMVKESVAEN